MLQKRHRLLHMPSILCFFWGGGQGQTAEGRRKSQLIRPVQRSAIV